MGETQKWVGDGVPTFDIATLRNKMERAFEKAKMLGELVGRVTRYNPIPTHPGGEIEVEVDSSIYFSRGGVKIGDYIGIVDPKTNTVILGVVTKVTRSDELALAGVEAPVVRDPLSSSQPESLLTNPIITVKLLLEGDPDSGLESRPVTIPVEPQSPAFYPSPEVLRYMLSLPASGVLVGALANSSGTLAGGRIPVRLPHKSILHHVLIVGTTGSGKTTLLKNMIASSTSEGGPLPVIIDMNGDFTQLPLKGDSPELPVYSSISQPGNVIIVLPVGFDTILELEEAKNIREGVARLYGGEVLARLLGYTPSWSCMRKNGIDICVARGEPFVLIPYFIDTVRRENMPGETLSNLMPGLTRLSMELLRSLRERFYKLSGSSSYPPLYIIAAALRSYLEAISTRRQGGHEEMASRAIENVAASVAGFAEPKDLENSRITNLGLSVAESIDLLLKILSTVKPHKHTVEALYRKIQGLMDTGVVDVSIAERIGLSWRINVLREPMWGDILKMAGEHKSPVVVDLSWLVYRSGSSIWAPRIVSYRVLQGILRARNKEWVARRRVKPVMVVIDEAHQFFPQEKGGGEEQEANRQIAAMISSLARLGRARGIGLVFSTHSPSDLHEIIMQLANTKIVLRTEKSHAERMGIPAELRDAIPFLQDRYMLVQSYFLRGGYVFAATDKPIPLHVDLSATLLEGGGSIS